MFYYTLHLIDKVCYLRIIHITEADAFTTIFNTNTNFAANFLKVPNVFISMLQYVRQVTFRCEQSTLANSIVTYRCSF